MPATDPRFKPKSGPQPQFLLAQHPPVAHPVASLGAHTASNGLDFSRSDAFGYRGNAFIAQLGDATPATGVVKAPKGFKVVRVDTDSGEVQDFLTNRRPGPASKVGGHGLERPIDVKFDRTGKVMYVLDFGIMTMPAVPAPERHTGVLWRVTRM